MFKKLLYLALDYFEEEKKLKVPITVYCQHSLAVFEAQTSNPTQLFTVYLTDRQQSGPVSLLRTKMGRENHEKISVVKPY